MGLPEWIVLFPGLGPVGLFIAEIPCILIVASGIRGPGTLIKCETVCHAGMY